MGFKIRHNNYRGGFLVARGSGGCNRWPWTNKSFRITTNPNRSSVITVPMEIRFRGDRRMAKRRARSGPRLFPSLSLSLSSSSTFSFCFPSPSPLHRPASRTDEKGVGRETGSWIRSMLSLSRDSHIFLASRNIDTGGHWLTWCALVYSKYTPRRNSGASEWWYARVSSKTDDASPRLLFSFFIYLETGLDRFPPTFSKYTHELRVFHCTRATKSDPFVSIAEPDAKYFATNVIPVSIFNAHAWPKYRIILVNSYFDRFDRSTDKAHNILPRCPRARFFNSFHRSMFAGKWIFVQASSRQFATKTTCISFFLSFFF